MLYQENMGLGDLQVRSLDPVELTTDEAIGLFIRRAAAEVGYARYMQTILTNRTPTATELLWTLDQRQALARTLYYAILPHAEAAGTEVPDYALVNVGRGVTSGLSKARRAIDKNHLAGDHSRCHPDCLDAS